MSTSLPTVAWAIYGRTVRLQRELGLPYAEARIRAVHEFAGRLARLAGAYLTYRDWVMELTAQIERLELAHELGGYGAENALKRARSGSGTGNPTRLPSARRRAASLRRG